GAGSAAACAGEDPGEPRRLDRRSSRTTRRNSSSSTSVIATRLRIVADSAAPDDVTASMSPYMDPSRAPRPDGVKNAKTATIAPTADVPPRKTIVGTDGCAPTERSSSHRPTPPSTHVPE